MAKEKIIKNTILLSERLDNNEDVKEIEILNCLKLMERIPELNVYKGGLTAHYYYGFRKIPPIELPLDLNKNEIFCQCVGILNGIQPSPSLIGKLLSNIFSLPDSQGILRDILFGSFLSGLWPVMNDPKNLDLAIEYGLEIVKTAFKIDNFDKNKIKLKRKNVKVINISGSGKKYIDFKLLNISSLSSIITATIGRKTNPPLIVVKTTSRATSSVTGSTDVFEYLGVNLYLPSYKMAKVASEIGIGIFDINNIVPKLNHVYDGRLYNVQIFAGLVGGAAIVCPIEADLINYGLTRGSQKVCLSILEKLYPDKNIIIVTGKDLKNRPVIDQISVISSTEIAMKINKKTSFVSLTPKDFGLEYGDHKEIINKKTTEENAIEFLNLLIGKGNKTLKSVVAMEVALNLYGIGIVSDLKEGFKLALETIESGRAIEVLKNLIILTKGDISKLNYLIKRLYE